MIKIEAALRIAASDTEIIQLQNRLKAVRRMKPKGSLAEHNHKKQIKDLQDQIKEAKKRAK